MPARALRFAILAAGAVLVIGAVAPPPTGKAAVAILSLSVLAALHGYGRLLATWVRDADAPVGLTLAWGVAAYLGIAGILIAIGAFGPAARIGILAGGIVLHTGWLLRHADRVVAAVRELRPTTLLAIAFSIAVLGVLLFAAAGRWSGPFADGETSYLGQVARLDDTGALADGFGFPRAAGLGGQVALSALVTPLDTRTLYLVDRGFMFAILVLLAVAAAGRTTRAKVAIAATLPVALTAAAEYLAGPGPFGSLVVLVLASAIAMDRASERASSRTMLLAVLTAAAAATIAHAALVLAFGVVVAATVRASRWELGGSWWRRRAAAIAFGVIVPYVIAAVHARAVSPRPAVAHASAASVATGVAAGFVFAMLVLLALPAGRHRGTLLAACASVLACGAIAATPAAALQYAVPVVVAIALLLVLLAIAGPVASTNPAPTHVPLGATVILVTAAVGVLAAARFAPGRPMLSWRTRAVQLVDDASALGELPPAASTRLAARYAEAQDAVPAGAVLGIWVERPDLIRYDRHRVTDLHTNAARKLAATLPRLELDYVLVDESTAGDAWRVLLSTAEELRRDDGLVVLALDRRALSLR